MTELTWKNKGLTINLSSVESEYDQNNNSGSKSSPSKSPKSFKESNGAVGLGIVAALNESDPSGRGPILSVSPRSNPIPILSPNFAKSAPNSSSSDESEEYTCVISHIGNNMIEKREYFDGDCVNGSEKTTLMVGTGEISAPSSPTAAAGDAPTTETESEFEPADFLSSCYMCEKVLHGLDIFMYRGEKAFCSAECRHKQISSDERREKRRSGVKKPIKYSVSPCSDQLQFFAGVVAA